MSFAYDLWYINNTTSTIQGINSKTFELSTPIDINNANNIGSTFSLAYNPSTNILWTTLTGSEFIIIQPLNLFNYTLGKSTSIYIGKSTNNLFINKLNNIAFLYTTSVILPINLYLLENYNSIESNSIPNNAVMLPNDIEIWSINTNIISIIDTYTMKLIQTITLNGNGYHLAVMPDNSAVWTAIYSTKTIQSFSTTNKNILNTINITSFTPYFLQITPGGNTLWIIGINSNGITCIQPLNLNTLTLGTMTEISSIVTCSPYTIFTIANNILWIGNPKYEGCTKCGLYGIDLTSFNVVASLLEGDDITGLINLNDFRNTSISPPLLIHNILNCEPTNNILDAETGVAK